LDHARVLLIQRQTECNASSGTWLLGNAYDRNGLRQKATLCDDKGTCSREYTGTFKDSAVVDAIWFPDQATTPRARTLTLTTATEKILYQDVVFPAQLEVTQIETNQLGGLNIRITADQSIDMAALWVMHGPEQRWSSAEQPELLRGVGNVLEAQIPEIVMEACDDTCDMFFQLAHVWQDDTVLSLGEVKQRVR